jgi:hypothetical protein
MNADESIRKHLRCLEERMMKADVRRSPGELGQLLADDFREFGGSGRAFNKQQIIEALQTKGSRQLWLENFQAVYLAPMVVLVTYRGLQVG